MLPVRVEPWVEADVFQAVLRDRALLSRIMFELQFHLPNNLAHYQLNRIPRSPRCFWYERDYSLNPHSFQLRRLRFVVRDSDPTMLEVIWVDVVM